MADKHAEQLIKLASQKVSQHQFEKAVNLLLEALKVAPENYEIYLYLASTYHDFYCQNPKKQYLRLATEYAEQALQHLPNNATCHCMLGSIFINKKKPKLAKKHLKEALRIDPLSAKCYQLLGHVSKGQKAFRYYQKALELDPKNVDCLTTLSNHYFFKKGNIKIAQQYATMALELDPSDIDALIIMGYILNQHGKYQEAQEHAKLALQQNPQNYQTLQLICVLESRNNIFGSLLKLQLWTINPINYVLYLIAWITLWSVCAYLGFKGLGWLFLIYTYSAKSLFQKKLEKYLTPQALKADY